jgi:hypothetical protein
MKINSISHREKHALLKKKSFFKENRFFSKKLRINTQFSIKIILT